MKILWLIQKYFDVALDKTSWLGMSSSLYSMGHEVCIMSGYRYRAAPLSSHIILLPSIKFPVLHYISLSISTFIASAIYVFKKRPDIVICCHMSAIIGVLLKCVTKIIGIKTKYMLDIRTIPVEAKGLKGGLLKFIFDFNLNLAKYFFDGVTVITEQMGRYISSKYKISKNMGVWTSAVDTSLFNPEKLDRNKNADIERFVSPKKNFIIMYHGIITANRGLTNVVKAINILVKEKRNDIKFVILGDGVAKYALEELVRKYHLDNYVRFIDPVPLIDVPYYISCCDLGILPFPNLTWWRVSSPLKLMEYLAMGKPVIATDIEAHKDVIGSNNCGFIIPDNKPETIADAILQAYSKKNFLKSMGENGRKLIEEKYTWDKQAENLISYINSL